MAIRRDKQRRLIGARLRELREKRRWTQADLAKRLHCSQARISGVERGQLSLTAEELLEVLAIFNVTVTHFGAQTGEAQDQLQKALARHGATELFENDDTLPSERYDDLNQLVRETLIEGTPRQLTGLAPVIVQNIDRLSLPRIHARLVELGLERRLGWLAENILVALRRVPRGELSTNWSRQYARAALVLETFLSSVPPTPALTPDIHDEYLRTPAGVAEVSLERSEISTRWSIVSSLQPDDFVNTLRATHVANSELPA